MCARSHRREKHKRALACASGGSSRSRPNSCSWASDHLGRSSGAIYSHSLLESSRTLKQMPHHHAKESVLFGRRVARPDEQLKILPAKTPVEFLELFKAFVPMEDRVDGLQRPILVEDDAAAEMPWPVKDDAVVVQEIKERVR